MIRYNSSIKLLNNAGTIFLNRMLPWINFSKDEIAHQFRDKLVVKLEFLKFLKNSKLHEFRNKRPQSSFWITKSIKANNLRFYRMTIHHGNNQSEHSAPVRVNI